MPKSNIVRVMEYLKQHPGENPPWAVAKGANLTCRGVVKICKVNYVDEVRIRYRYDDCSREAIGLEWVGA